jgi:hypothetical protein
LISGQRLQRLGRLLIVFHISSCCRVASREPFWYQHLVGTEICRPNERDDQDLEQIRLCCIERGGASVSILSPSMVVSMLSYRISRVLESWNNNRHEHSTEVGNRLRFTFCIGGLALSPKNASATISEPGLERERHTTNDCITAQSKRQPNYLNLEPHIATFPTLQIHQFSHIQHERNGLVSTTNNGALPSKRPGYIARATKVSNRHKDSKDNG